MIPFSKPDIGQEEIEAVTKVLKSGWLAAGKETEAFEKEFADYITPGDPQLDVSYEPYYCIFTNSCTSALKMAYKWAWDKGYYSISYPRNTFCATYSSAIEMGLRAFARDNDNEGRDREQLRVNVHYGGVKDETPCLIEDSAHRIEPNDPLVGKIRCYSFYATKNMTTGSGGMFVTNDKEIYDRARLYWRDGLSTSTADRHKEGGKKYNYNILTMAGGYDGNDIAATIGRCQLKKLPGFNQRRNKIVQQYNKEFKQTWKGNHLYPYFVQREEEVHELMDYLDKQGIKCGYHYPNTGWLGVSLPLYPSLTDKEVNYIIDSVKNYEKTKL